MLKRLAIWLIKWSAVLAVMAAAAVGVYAWFGDLSAPVGQIEEAVTIDVE